MRAIVRAVQWLERITISDRLRQSRRIGSASLEAAVVGVRAEEAFAL
jgi:hypothetical protein